MEKLYFDFAITRIPCKHCNTRSKIIYPIISIELLKILKAILLYTLSTTIFSYIENFLKFNIKQESIIKDIRSLMARCWGIICLGIDAPFYFLKNNTHIHTHTYIYIYIYIYLFICVYIYIYIYIYMYKYICLY